MTAVVCWLNKEHTDNPAIWVASDSLISRPAQAVAGGAASVDPLSSYAQKIFSIPVIYRAADREGYLSKTYRIYNIGFSAAGNATVTHIVVEKLRFCLANLGTLAQGQSLYLCLKKIAEIAKEIIGDVVIDLGSKLKQGEIINLECLLVGYCFVCEELHAIKIELDYSSAPLTVVCTDVVFQNDDDLVQLGNNKKEIRDEIEAKRQAMAKDQYWWRVPKHVLAKTIKDKKYDSIGGSIQVGIAYKEDFDLLIESKIETGDGKPTIQMSAGGLNINKLNAILKDPIIIASQAPMDHQL